MANIALGQAYARLNINGPDITLVPSAKEFHLQEDPLDAIIDYRTNDGFLLRVSVQGAVLSVLFFHGLSDGSGISVFLKFLLTEYYKDLGEEVLPAPDLWSIDGPIDEEEIVKPISRLPETTAPHRRTIGKFHAIKGKNTDDVYSYTFSLNKEKFVSYFSAIDASPNAMGVMALGKAIQKIDGDKVKENIDIAIAINTKPFLGCPKSVYPSLLTRPFHFSEGTLAMEDEVLYTCIKGKLIHDSQEEELFPQIKALKAMGDMFPYRPDLDSRRLLAKQTTDVARNTANVSYTGDVQWGSIGNHILEIGVYADSVTPHLELFCSNDRFFVAISSKYEFSAYAEAVRSYLDGFGFDCTPIKTCVFHAAPGKVKKLKMGLNRATLRFLRGVRNYKKSLQH